MDVKRSDGPHAASVLDTAHAALLEAIAPMIKAADLSPEELVAPDRLMAGVWRRPDKDHPFGEGFTAPTKVTRALPRGSPVAAITCPSPADRSITRQRCRGLSVRLAVCPG